MPWHRDPFLLLPSDGLLLVDAAGTVRHVDKFARSIMGASCPPLGAVIGDEWPELARALDDFAATAGGARDELVGHGGEQFAVRLFRTDDGLGVGLLASTDDREGHGAAFDLYERVLRKLNEMVLITTAEPLDRPGPVIVYVNDAFLTTTGYDRDDVIGRSPRLLQGSDPDVEPRRQFREKFDAWLPGRVEIQNFAKDGESFWSEIDFAPIADETGWFTNWVSVQTVVTQRHAASEALAQSEERYRLLAENSLDVIVLLRGGVVVWVSPSLESALGWLPVDWIGQMIDGFVHPDDLERFAQDRIDLYAGKAVVSRYRVRAATGECRWIESRAKPHLDIEGRPDGVVATLHGVDSEVRVQQELDRRARFDTLTGLVNRKEIMQRLTGIIGDRRTGEEAAVLFCDVDNFKDVNDEHGHAAGDAVLRTISSRIQDCIRTGDVAARIGGDEMLVVLTGVHDLDEAVALAERIRSTVATPVELGMGWLRATLSIGVALAAPGESPDDVIARADRAMYRAKEAGRDRVVAPSGPDR